MKMLITAAEYFGAHDTSKVTKQQWFNVIDLLYRINLLRQEIGLPFTVNSGYRPEAYNLSIGGSKKSSHIECAAIDLADAKGSLKKMMQANNNALLIKYDLYMEAPADTVGWCHLSIRPPLSGMRVFGK